MDFGGILLFTAGFLLFLMGLSWGGTLYPWGSAHVIATLVAGAVIIVAFVLYGKKALAQRTKTSILTDGCRNLYALAPTFGPDASF